MKKFCFIFALLGIFACSEDEHMTADYFKAQQRDSRFFGKWMYVNPDTFEEEITTYYHNYTKDGEFHLIYRETGEKNKRVEYYYTKGDRLYVLNPGSGFKVSASVYEFRYEFSNSDSILVLQDYTNGELSNYKEFLKRK
ncbi:hypothetical protein ACILDS_05635 [Capnocytophaga canis]|uniref:Lipocalin-like domain-containing protein n=3 Tax=Capnocytophaga canis TaxID=1848903 RepID=A0A3A1YCZ1_9FLAO|nr:hypothetical protein [Capnocytophaga canis]RIY36123.1 hypothetical protein CKY20_08265 [Capnocytophaga canis]